MSELRSRIDENYLVRDAHSVELCAIAGLAPDERRSISARAATYVSKIREGSDPGLMEVFLAEYGLSTDEGIALMCLAEAFLRVPDADTIDALIEDKIAPSDWGTHLGQSSSSLVNASTWALMITGRLLDDDHPGIARTLRGAVKRLGEPVIRVAVDRAMREMGRQFVLGENITDAMARGAGMEKRGFTYSYDMLGEAACTDADAKAFHLSYSRAISAIAEGCVNGSVAENPGISVKLSALHSRYEFAQKERVMEELVPRLRSLALLAKSAGMGFNIDAEEADRLSLSLDVIEAVVSEPALRGWDGFGIVVQAYAPRAPFVIDWFHDLAERYDRKFMLRLVKGAYWDAEIKRAQVLGLDGFPVFTSKALTDVSYLANARKLLGMTDRIYPQFATHNAHTVAGILHMADQLPRDAFEFQRLHGMGEALHTMVLKAEGTRCRIYAPVGEHEDLLAYLVRRLLENGANSSFVNQIVDDAVPPETVAADPFARLAASKDLPTGRQIFLPDRMNSEGLDISHEPTLSRIFEQRGQFRNRQWVANPIVFNADNAGLGDAPLEVRNPAQPADLVGSVREAVATAVKTAFDDAAPWDVNVADRANVLREVARLFEANAPEFFAILQREAGKTLADAEGEVREAVDFLYYYAAEAERGDHRPRGIWACISPWNFPLAIFTGQIAAALATGNAVLAKPAQQTPLIACRAVELMHKAGVPRSALQLLPGDGGVGAVLTSDPHLGGVAFTGSTATARLICTAMAENCAPATPLIAETGGLNAMIVDSTALPEHAVRDILASAFQSAGQRCSALRVLYVQKDVADTIIEMLAGAMNELSLGDPWEISSDVGPIIDEGAKKKITAHIAIARSQGRVMHECEAPAQGSFVAPTMIQIDGIRQLEEEIFGPVLHVATFEASDLENVLKDINNTGYGLTFGLHTRIDERVQEIVDTVSAGNIYVNRNQIGAVVGSQPFGGEGLSGTGPKAGGPNYLTRFAEPAAATLNRQASKLADNDQHVPVPIDLPGPTGESNRLRFFRKDPILCLGPDATAVAEQCKTVEALGGTPIPSAGSVDQSTLKHLVDEKIGGVLWWGDQATGRSIAQALAKRSGPIVPLITAHPDVAHIMHERHVCVDTTAAGGNAALLAEVG